MLSQVYEFSYCYVTFEANRILNANLQKHQSSRSETITFNVHLEASAHAITTPLHKKTSTNEKFTHVDKVRDIDFHYYIFLY